MITTKQMISSDTYYLLIQIIRQGGILDVLYYKHCLVFHPKKVFQKHT